MYVFIATEDELLYFCLRFIRALLVMENGKKSYFS